MAKCRYFQQNAGFSKLLILYLPAYYLRFPTSSVWFYVSLHDVFTTLLLSVAVALLLFLQVLLLIFARSLFELLLLIPLNAAVTVILPSSPFAFSSFVLLLLALLVIILSLNPFHRDCCCCLHVLVATLLLSSLLPVVVVSASVPFIMSLLLLFSLPSPVCRQLLIGVSLCD